MSRIILTPTVIDERRCHGATDLHSLDLRVVVALIAARRMGRVGATRAELMLLTGIRHVNMFELERKRWISRVGKSGKVVTWQATPFAVGRLGFHGWQTLLFSEEDLPRVDPNVEGFLVPEATAMEAAS